MAIFTLKMVTMRRKVKSYSFVTQAEDGIIFSKPRCCFEGEIDSDSPYMNKGRFYKLVFNVRQYFCFTWMSSRLSHRIFLSFIQSRSPLRSLVKNKNLRHDSRKYIAS